MERVRKEYLKKNIKIAIIVFVPLIIITIVGIVLLAIGIEDSSATLTTVGRILFVFGLISAVIIGVVSIFYPSLI